MQLTDLNKVNAIISADTAAVVPKLITEQNKYGIQHSSDGFNKIKTSTSIRDGIIRKITFKFKKTGIYREKGAGRGYGGKKGSTWRNSKGQQVSTNPESLGKAGTGSRPEAPWFNPVIQKFADDLSVKVADEFVEIAFNNLMIK